MGRLEALPESIRTKMLRRLLFSCLLLRSLIRTGAGDRSLVFALPDPDKDQ